MAGSVLKVSRASSKKHKTNAVNRPQPTAPIRMSGASVTGSVLTSTYESAVILGNAVPQYTTDVAGATPVSAEQTSPTTIEVTFSASIAAATEVRIPYEEPAVRNASGGFVSTSTFPLAA